MLGVDECVVNLLVHLRIFELNFCGSTSDIRDGHRFIMKASNRAPHLSIPPLRVVVEFLDLKMSPSLVSKFISGSVRNWLFAI
jgi:hypothetical protein